MAVPYRELSAFLSFFLIKTRFVLRTDFPDALLGSDKASAQYTVSVIEHRRLPRSNSRSLRSKLHQQVAVIRQLKDLARNRTAPVSDAHRKIRTGQEFFDIRSHGRFYQHVFSLQLVGNRRILCVALTSILCYPQTIPDRYARLCRGNVRAGNPGNPCL